MARSKEAAREKIKNIGQATCNVCGEKKADVCQIRKNWFTSINICDGCGQQLFFRYKKGVGGKAK